MVIYSKFRILRHYLCEATRPDASFIILLDINLSSSDCVKISTVKNLRLLIPENRDAARWQLSDSCDFASTLLISWPKNDVDYAAPRGALCRSVYSSLRRTLSTQL
eukprot:g1999.t1